MQHSDLELRLLNRLRERGQAAVGLGIDLGTTKSSVAYARFDPVTGEVRCDCLRFGGRWHGARWRSFGGSGG